MDAREFDALKTSVSRSGTRWGRERLVSAAPLASAMGGLLREEDAAGQGGGAGVGGGGNAVRGLLIMPGNLVALRTETMTYVEYADAWRALYDLPADPHQLHNRVDELDTQQARTFAGALANLTACSGTSSRTAEDAHLPMG